MTDDLDENQATLSELNWDSERSESTSKQNSPDRERTGTTSGNTLTRQSRTQQPVTGPFTINRSDIPEGSHPLSEDAVTGLLTDGPEPPLEDAVHSLATRDPTPTTAEERYARALYIYGRAQIDALPGYSLDESMIPLRDCIEAELDVSTNKLTDNDLITAKRLDARWKYYRLSTKGRHFIKQSGHPSVALLQDQTQPVIQNGPIHNRGVRLGGGWLLAATECNQVAQPDLQSPTPIDLGGFVDGERRWVGEVVSAEDVNQESQDSNTLVERCRYVTARPERSLLIFEDSSVAVATFRQLDINDVIDIPECINYHRYSIAQLRQRVLPEIDSNSIDQIESVVTLMKDQ